MCKTQDTVNERRGRAGHESYFINISDHSAAVCPLKRDLGRAI